MSHDEAIILLADHGQGRLPGELAGQLESHLGACGDCRGVAAAYDALATAVATEAAPAHPPAHAIIAHALASGELNAAEALETARHVATCPTCADEVERTRCTDAESRRETGALPAPVRGLAAAAAVVLAIATGSIGYWAGGSREAVNSRPGLAARPVLLHVIDVTTRDGSRPVLRLHPGESEVLIGLALPPAAVEASGGLRLEVGPAGERARWGFDLGPAEVSEHVRGSGILTFALPSASLSGSASTIRVLRRRSPAAEPLLETTFDVRTEP